MTTKELAQELRKAQREVADSLSGATEPEMQTAPEPGEWTASEFSVFQSTQKGTVLMGSRFGCKWG